MDGLDFFNPSDGGESYDPAAFERFKEQVKKNGQFVAAMQRDEKKKKKKEDALAQIILAFIKANKNSGLMVIVSELLEQNIPASFILAIIVLGNPEIRTAIDQHEKEQLALESGEKDFPMSSRPALPALNEEQQATEFSLVARFNDSTIPLKIKLALDEWGVGIFQAGTSQPFKILETVLDKTGHVKNVVIEACATVLQSYLTVSDEATFASRGHESFVSFGEFVMRGIMQKLKDQVENQKQLN